jgi:hypothetical protein
METIGPNLKFSAMLGQEGHLLQLQAKEHATYARHSLYRWTMHRYRIWPKALKNTSPNLHPGKKKIISEADDFIAFCRSMITIIKLKLICNPSTSFQGGFFTVRQLSMTWRMVALTVSLSSHLRTVIPMTR